MAKNRQKDPHYGEPGPGDPQYGEGGPEKPDVDDPKAAEKRAGPGTRTARVSPSGTASPTPRATSWTTNTGDVANDHSHR
jgi:hypothetical protein